MEGGERPRKPFEWRIPWTGEERRRFSRSRRRRDLAFGIGSGLLLVGVLFSAFARKDLLEASAQVERSRETLSSIDALSHHLTDAKAALSLRSGGPPGSVARPAESAMAAAVEELARLALSVEDDSSQRARCRALGPLLESIGNAQGEVDLEKASSAIGTARSWLHAISDRERNRLTGWPAEAASLNFRLNGAVAFTGLLAVLLLAASLFWLRREDSDRRRAQGLAASILETVPSGVLSIDSSGTVLSMNQAVERMFGFAPGELIGRNVSMLMPSPTRDEHDGYIARYLTTREARVIGLGREVTGRHREGHSLPLHVAVGELTAGDRPTFTGVLTDISARKRAEAELAASVSYLQGILDSATEMAVIAAGLDGVITLFNRGAERMLGYSASEVVGRETPERFHVRTEVADRGRAISLELGRPVRGFDVLVERARRGESEEREWTYVRKDRSTLPVMLAVTPLLDAKGTAGGFLGVARDITAQKKAEKLKREFISIVSHELRTPLTSIRGSLGLLAAGRAGALPTRALPLVEIAHRNAERLVLIVNDILDVEKMESGEMRFGMQLLDVNQIVEHAVAANQAYAHQLGIRLEARPIPGKYRVRGDADRLIQVLTNLLSNAAKFSPEGAAVEVTTSAKDESVTIEIRDHGPGIPEEFQPRLFQKFAQADGTDSKRRGGTGLGLAIAKTIVEAHDGRLGFETAAGWGTAFRVELPRHRETSGLSITGIPGRRVLVCEGDRDVASLLTGLLRRDGIGTQVASTAAEARELLGKGRYSAMTLDIHLGGGDGIELFRWIRGRPGTARLPVVVVSGGEPSERASLESDSGGILAWLERPIAEDKLLSAVRGAVIGSVGRRPRVLHVEDDADVATLVRTMLGDAVDVVGAGTLVEASELLLDQDFDLVVLDVGLPDGSGLELLAAGDTRVRPAPVIVYSAADVEAIVKGEVLAVFVKGRTTTEQLVETIVQSLRTLVDGEGSESPRRDEESDA